MGPWGRGVGGEGVCAVVRGREEGGESFFFERMLSDVLTETPARRPRPPPPPPCLLAPTHRLCMEAMSPPSPAGGDRRAGGAAAGEGLHVVGPGGKELVKLYGDAAGSGRVSPLQGTLVFAEDKKKQRALPFTCTASPPSSGRPAPSPGSPPPPSPAPAPPPARRRLAAGGGAAAWPVPPPPPLLRLAARPRSLRAAAPTSRCPSSATRCEWGRAIEIQHTGVACGRAGGWAHDTKKAQHTPRSTLAPLSPSLDLITLHPRHATSPPRLSPSPDFVRPQGRDPHHAGGRHAGPTVGGPGLHPARPAPGAGPQGVGRARGGPEISVEHGVGGPPAGARVLSMVMRGRGGLAK